MPAAASLRLSPLPAATKVPAAKQQLTATPASDRAATGAVTTGPATRPQPKQVFSLPPISISGKATPGAPVSLASGPATSAGPGANQQLLATPGSAAGRALQTQSQEGQAVRRQQGSNQQQLNPPAARSPASAPGIVRAGGLPSAGPPLKAKASPKSADVPPGASAAVQKPAPDRAAPVPQTSMLVDSGSLPIVPSSASSAKGQNGLRLQASSPLADVTAEPGTIPSLSSADGVTLIEAEMTAPDAPGRPALPQPEAEAPEEAEGDSLLPMDAAPAPDDLEGYAGQGGSAAVVAEQFQAALYSPQLHAAAVITASTGENGGGLGSGSGDLAAADEEQAAAPAQKRARAFEPDSPSAEVPLPDDYLKSIHTLELVSAGRVWALCSRLDKSSDPDPHPAS